MSEASALIQLQNVSKVFYTDEVETHALDGVDLSIHPGEYVAISGPSGCGKSTLLSILGLLDSPTAGDYTLNGWPVAQLSQAERARTRNREVGFIFQGYSHSTRVGGISLARDVRRQAGRERKRLEGGARRVARAVFQTRPEAKRPDLVEPAVHDAEGCVVVERSRSTACPDRCTRRTRRRSTCRRSGGSRPFR